MIHRKVYRCGPNDRFEVRVGPLYTNLVDHTPRTPLEASTACTDETDALQRALDRLSNPTARRALARAG